MTRSRKYIPSISFCQYRQRKWKVEQKHSARKALHNFTNKYEDEYWLECHAPTIRSHSNLWNSPADMGKGDRAMLPLSEWFEKDEMNMSNSWYRYCICK